jgi:hypothetical protein
MSPTELQNAAIAAMDAGDWDTAIVKLMALQLCRPTSMNEGTTGGATKGIQFDRIDSLIKQCKQMKAAAAAERGGPIRQTRIIYQRPDAAEVY